MDGSASSQPGTSTDPAQAAKEVRRLRHSLLPVPKQIEWAPGLFAIGADTALHVRVDDARIERAFERWRRRFATGRTVGASAGIHASVDRACSTSQQGYCLAVTPDRVSLIGASAAGCFHGIQTLTQLSSTRLGGVPCCHVADSPDFATRGVLHDVSRGKVPTLATLKLLADRLAAWKVNQLQLYIEHAFVFSFDPEICAPDEGLTPDEIAELGAYCRERFIDLVPALATFGHMGRILSMPKYAHLAEIEARLPWAKQDWQTRARGLTLDVTQQESWTLVSRLWTDVLDAFSSPVVNICGDEPWDLGTGRSKQACETHGRARVYMDHVRRTRDWCASHGRATQVFGDILCLDPASIQHLPKTASRTGDERPSRDRKGALLSTKPDRFLTGAALKEAPQTRSKETAVLHWGYDESTDYGATARFVEAGFDTLVCPGTTGWKRILNAMGLAEQNIGAFAKTGRKYGAVGMITTDWGDHGHFNALACSWHGLCLGAAFAWDSQHPNGTEFDRRFAGAVLGMDDTDCVAALRSLADWAGAGETWRWLYQPLEQLQREANLPDLPQTERAVKMAREALAHCERIEATSDAAKADRHELGLACRFTGLLAEKVLATHQLGREHKDGGPIVNARAWAERVQDAGEEYAAAWLRRNKPSGLPDVVAALSHASEDMTNRCHGADHETDPVSLT